MKKLLLAFMALIMIFCSACSHTQVPADTSSVPDTTAMPETTNAPETTSAPEEIKKIENRIFENGSSEYSIVFAYVADAKDAMALSDIIKKHFGVRLQIKNALLASPGEKMITVESYSPSPLVPPLKTRNDFAIQISENKVLLSFSNELSRDFLFDYFEREIISRAVNGNLTLTDDDSMVYSESELFATTYVDYWKAEHGDVTKEFSAQICEEYYYEGRYGITMPYRLYVPSNYTEDRQYPVFVYLHGAGHRGNDNVLTVSNIVYNFWNHENVPMDECIVLIPQCPTGKQWVDWPWGKGNYSLKDVKESVAMKTLVSLIGEIKDTYSTDESRYYLYGMSMGGYGTWDLLARHPKLFTAAYPVCGGGPEDAAFILKNIPIWTIHSDDDKTVPFSASEGMVNAIKVAGGTDIFFKKLTGYDHAIGTVSASDSEIFEWLFSQKK